MTAMIELMVQVLVVPTPDAQPDQATDVAFVVVAVNVTVQPGPPQVG
jgi:hypothetical protein